MCRDEVKASTQKCTLSALEVWPLGHGHGWRWAGKAKLELSSSCHSQEGWWDDLLVKWRDGLEGVWPFGPSSDGETRVAISCVACRVGEQCLAVWFLDESDFNSFMEGFNGL